MAKVISGYSREEATRRYEVCRERFTDDNTMYNKFDIAMEASMLSQRIMDLAKEDIISEIDTNEPDINTDAWIQVPKGDDMKFWLNKYGKREWKNNEGYTVLRSYYWVDRVIELDPNRKVISDLKFSDFIKSETYYVPVLPEPGKEIKPQNVVQ